MPRGNWEFVRLEREGWISTLTMSRPPVNALSRKMVAELKSALTEIASDNDTSIVIITSDQKHFCGGADLKERATIPEGEVAAVVAEIGEMVTMVANLPQPTVASIFGTAVAGGAEMALACDIRMMAENGRFGLNETSLGIIPGAGGTQRLARLIGTSRAKTLIYTAELMDAAHCMATGAVNMILPNKMLRDGTLAWAQSVAKNAPLALRAAKKAMNAGEGRPMEDGLAAESNAYAAIIGTSDRLEGLQAFLEKRDPVWKGE